jgi:hypothetical protein
VVIDTWRPLSGAEHAALEAEATTFPLADVAGRIRVRWSD